MANYKYILSGLNCANCAGKIEKAVAGASEVENANLNFTTKTIYFSHTSNKENQVMAWLQKVVDNIEEDVTVTAVENNQPVKKSKLPFILMVVGIIVFAIALVFEFIIAPKFNFQGYAIAIPYGISAILCGYQVFSAGIKSVIKLRIDETTLLTIAVIAAFCLGEFFEACLVTILFAIGEFLEEKAVESSRKDIARLAEIRPDTATLVYGNSTRVVPAEQVKLNSIIVVSPYQRIPLDGEIVEGSTNIDASALTGESMPVSAAIGSSIMSGMLNGEGLIKVRVTKTYEASAASRIVKMVEESSAAKGNSEKIITRFARIYTPIIIVMAVLLAVIPPVLGFGEFTMWLSRSLVFLVASCPCAMVISVPLGFYAGIGNASKNGVLIKGGKYLEALAKADTFVFDKTGTLTTEKLTLESVVPAEGYTKDEVLALAAACEKHSVHPTATAIKNGANSIALPTLTDYREIAGIGVKATYNGSEVICGNYRILESSTADKNAIYLTINGALVGTFTVSDTIRNEASAIMTELKSLGAKTTAMLTGDNEKTAKKVATVCGLTEYHAGLLPADKVELAKELKAKSKKTVYVGDGINDAPVLAIADCGMAMGLGSDIAIESADGVLSAGNLTKLPYAIKISRKVMKTVAVNIGFALVVKGIILVLAALGYAPMWLAVFADTGVSLLCVLNSVRLLK